MSSETELPRKSTRRTTASVQAAAQEAAAKEAKSLSGNQGSAQTDRPRTHQPDNASAHAGDLVNPAREALNRERAGSPKKLSVKPGSKNVDPPSSIGDTAGQSPVGTQPAPASVQAIGAETTVRSSGSVAAPAAAGKASPGETANADATREVVDQGKATREMVDLGKPTTRPLKTYAAGCKPVCRSGSPAPHTSDPGAVMFAQAVKSSTASVQAVRQKTQAAAEVLERKNAEAGNTGEGGDDNPPPRVVRSEEQDPIALTSIPSRHLPHRPAASRSNTQNSLPADGLEAQEQDLGGADHVGSSDNESTDDFVDDEDYESARELAERAAIAGYKETLSQEEFEALQHQQFQAQQREAHRQMYLQQPQLIEVAHGTAPKSHDGRSTATMLGIRSNDKPQTSREKSLRRKLAEMEYALRQSQSSCSNLDYHYKKTWNRANALSEELQRSQHQVHRVLDDNRSLTHELEAVKVHLSDAKTLSEVRGKELKGAQVFLTKADTLSTTDVVQKVNALNEEIFQAAALLGEMLQNTERTERTQEQVTVAFEEARWMLGERMASILATESMNLRTDLNPLLVQIVLQMAITTWCRAVVSSWKPGDTPVADFLSAIYSEIRQVEDQAVSGRWRSITRAQLRSSSDDWTRNLMTGLLNVLIISGWSTREPDQKNQFERRLPPIFKAVQDLRKALGEDVTSMDMEVVVIEAGEAFDPVYMEDAYGDARAAAGNGKKVAPEKVSGTTGLGLHKITMKHTQKGPTPHAEMVLLPKVALDATLKEAMDPAPPPSKLRKSKPKRDGDSRSGGFGNGGGAPATGGATGGGTSVVDSPPQMMIY